MQYDRGMVKTAILVIGLAAFGCGKSASDKPSAGCMDVGTVVATHYAEKVKAAKSDTERDAYSKLGPVAAARLAEHCQKDGWSAEVIECAKAGDLKACSSKLTPEQLEKLKADPGKIEIPPEAFGSGGMTVPPNPNH